MPRRPCLTCPALAEPGKPRCKRCESGYQRHRNATRPQYRGTWPAQSRQQIADYRAQHGDTCPGWGRDPHPIDPTQWTTDHDEGPMCRSCNGTKGATHDRARRAEQRTLDAQHTTRRLDDQ